MLWVLAVPWALGVLNFAQKAVRDDSRGLENAIEWIVSVFLQVWFLLLYIGWRRTDFRVRVRTG